MWTDSRVSPAVTSPRNTLSEQTTLQNTYRTERDASPVQVPPNPEASEARVKGRVEAGRWAEEWERQEEREAGRGERRAPRIRQNWRKPPELNQQTLAGQTEGRLRALSGPHPHHTGDH